MDKLNTILKNAENEMKSLNHPYVGTEHLILSILKEESNFTVYLKNMGLEYSNFRERLVHLIGSSDCKIDYIIYTPMLKHVISIARKKSKENNIEITDKLLFLIVISEGEGIGYRILDDMNIDFSEIEANCDVNFNCGVMLNDLSYNDTLIGRDNEIEEITEVLLRKNKCNPLLLGKAGVGKSSIIMELVKRIKTKNICKELWDYRILQVDLGNLLSGCKYRGDFEEKVSKLLSEIQKTKNVILFIDEIHTLTHCGASEGAIGAGDLFKPLLATGKIKVIGATTLSEYHKYIETDSALARRFHNIVIDEPSVDETKLIINGIKCDYEKFYNLRISNSFINYIVYICDKYIHNRANPDKTIEFLDVVCSRSRLKNKLFVTKDDVISYFYLKYGVCLNGSFNNIVKKNWYVDNIDNLRDYIKSKYKSDRFINIDCSSTNNYELLGYRDNTLKNYVFKELISNPFALVYISNYDNNSSISETINEIVNKRVVTDFFGNEINFSNCLIVFDSYFKESIGFTKTIVNRNNFNLIKWNKSVLVE